MVVAVPGYSAMTPVAGEINAADAGSFWEGNSSSDAWWFRNDFPNMFQGLSLSHWSATNLPRGLWCMAAPRRSVVWLVIFSTSSKHTRRQASTKTVWTSRDLARKQTLRLVCIAWWCG